MNNVPVIGIGLLIGLVIVVGVIVANWTGL
jgi:hypothetical protein